MLETIIIGVYKSLAELLCEHMAMCMLMEWFCCWIPACDGDNGNIKGAHMFTADDMEAKEYRA